MKHFLFGLISLPLLVACTTIQEEYYGPYDMPPPPRAEVYRNVEPGYYHAPRPSQYQRSAYSAGRVPHPHRPTTNVRPQSTHRHGPVGLVRPHSLHGHGQVGIARPQGIHGHGQAGVARPHGAHRQGQRAVASSQNNHGHEEVSSNAHGHISTNQQGHAGATNSTGVIKHPSEARDYASSNTHGHH